MRLHRTRTVGSLILVPSNEEFMEPKLECVQPVLMSRDVVSSIRFYEKLGFVLAGQDAPHDPKYARVRRDDVEIHLQWHDAKEWNYPNDRPTYRFVVRDVDGLYERFCESRALADATTVAETPWGLGNSTFENPTLDSGFRPASAHGIKCEWEVPDDVFMLLVLDQAKMQGVSGLAKYRYEFSSVS
jgi:hypothetical protein